MLKFECLLGQNINKINNLRAKFLENYLKLSEWNKDMNISKSELNLILDEKIQ
jgi:hypothetical protein